MSTRQNLNRLWLACLALAVLVGQVDTGMGAEAGVSDGLQGLAWIRFEKSAKSYEGVPYLWLGDADIRLTIHVKPAPNHVLELLWGAKNDMRDATATINGRQATVRGGGYQGFRWLVVAIPPEVAGERYEVRLSQGFERPGFIAAVRLRGENGAQAAKHQGGAAAHRIEVATAAITRPPAFPAMQAIWDREPQQQHGQGADSGEEEAFRVAERHARQANEQWFRCQRFVEGWLKHADAKTGLIPRNLDQDRDIWNAKDSAADNYPFMVLTAALTDRPLFEGRMLDMLRTEARLTSRLDRLPDTWSFSRQAFLAEKADFESIAFGSAEYCKDGLLPLTEWLGPSPWSERMLGILDDLWKHAPIDTPFGRLPTLNVEVDGDLLQALSRTYWMTGDRKYLDWAIRLGDYYLLGTHHPTRNFDSLRLRDHGCEIVSGLCELYYAVSVAAPEKKKAYEEPVHAMLDRILEVARNEHGMLYDSVNPKTGEHSAGICDTWGYNYNGLYTVCLIDKTEAYRQSVRKVLGNLRQHLTDHDWGSADEFADTVEGAINLYNREPIDSVPEWIDSEIKDMWRAQRPDGILEGWHGDGNSARTAIMYALWKTQGLTIEPWRADVRLGTVRRGDRLYVSLTADRPWHGRLIFDKPRHRVNLHLPIDYPRINQFPEWFTAASERQYTVAQVKAGQERVFEGRQLQEGIPLELAAGAEVRLIIKPVQ